MSEVHRTAGRPKRFTPEVLAAIPRWVELGATYQEIADVLDTTVGAVHNARSRAKTAPRSATVRAELGRVQWVRLRREADLRGMSASQLFVGIVAAVVEEDLFCAVLGDYDDLDTCG